MLACFVKYIWDPNSLFEHIDVLFIPIVMVFESIQNFFILALSKLYEVFDSKYKFPSNSDHYTDVEALYQQWY